MEHFTRSVEFRMVETDGRTLEGYAAVFDSPTVINNFEGHFVVVIQRGAFAKTVRNNPKPVLQFDHGTHPLIGGMPIGTIQELREDDQGLFVKARLSDSFLTEPVRVAIADGALNGMSFKFTIPKGGVTVTTENDTELRTLTEVTLHELGPVVWPAYADTSVGVRSKSLADILTADEDARTLFAAALYGATTEFDTTGDIIESLAVRSDDESDEPTDEPTDETTDPDGSVQESVRSDDEDELTATTSSDLTVPASSKEHRQRMAEIVAAKVDIYVLAQLKKEELSNGVKSQTDG